MEDRCTADSPAAGHSSLWCVLCAKPMCGVTREYHHQSGEEGGESFQFSKNVRFGGVRMSILYRSIALRADNDGPIAARVLNSRGLRRPQENVEG